MTTTPHDDPYRPPAQSLHGVFLLLFATLLWGSTVVVIKRIEIPSSMINLGRFVLASVVLAPFLRRDRRIWFATMELALWLFAAYATQSIGLKYTSVNRSAFITALNVIFVPILSSLLGPRISPVVWVATILAVIGCGMLCYDGKPPNIGDLWTLFTAITWAMYIVRMENNAQKFSPLLLAAPQIAMILVLSLGWAAAEHSITIHLPWWSILYLGLPATAGTIWLQAAGQRTVPPAQTAVIFTLEPVFAALCGYIVLGERLGQLGLTGAAMIIVAAIISQIPSLRISPD